VGCTPANPTHQGASVLLGCPSTTPADSNSRHSCLPNHAWLLLMLLLLMLLLMLLLLLLLLLLMLLLPPDCATQGVVHLLGGAFAGAAPQLLYRGLGEAVAGAGYTVVATPYAVTFRHDRCAAAVRLLWHDRHHPTTAAIQH
jgi:Protein of unknown function (DUF1350)